MDVGEAKMQDQRAREAAEQRRMAIEQGFAGIGQVAQGVGDLAPLYGRSMNDKRAQKLMADDRFMEQIMPGFDRSKLTADQELSIFNQIANMDISGKNMRIGQRTGFRIAILSRSRRRLF